jgi:hypothetical protein
MSDKAEMSPPAREIRERLVRVRQRIASAAAKAGRRAEDVSLVAVTKRHPAATMEAGFAAGVRRVGENYAQELVAKLDTVACAAELQWHFIGTLQRNKAKQVAGRVALIHAVDSLGLAQEIDRQMARRQAVAGAGHPVVQDGPAVQDVLIAVNVGGEEQKSGVLPAAAAELLAAIDELTHVRCTGLMTMPPLANRPEDNRPHFRALSELCAALATAQRPLPILSMGTTGDFEVAVEEGATLVRVGTALFGPRPG